MINIDREQYDTEGIISYTNKSIHKYSVIDKLT